MLGLARIYLLCFSFLLLVGCTNEQQGGAQHLEIEVHQLPADNGWTVVWRFEEPIHGIAFPRTKDPFRGRTWKTATTGTRIKTIAGRETLYSSKPIREFRVRFPAYPFEIYNDYAFVTPFSDGSATIFLGHLESIPIKCVRLDCTAPSSLVDLPTSNVTMSLRAGYGSRVVFEGKERGQQVTLSGVPEAIAYFGSLPVREISSFDAVLDPALPSWARRDLVEHLPRILETFTRETGYSLPKKPVLFFPHPLNTNKRVERAMGGVIGSEFIMSLEGGKWRKRTSRRREEFLRLLAHEAFHLWNANLFYSPDVDGGAWLHEGAAEALSQRALYDLGILSRRRYIELQNESVNRCIVGRDVKSPDSGEELRREHRTHYYCGSALHFLVQTAVSSETRSSVSLYRFWSDIFKSAEAEENRYTHRMFVDAVDRIAPQITNSVQALTGGAVTETDAYFSDALGSINITSSALLYDFPDWYNRLMSQRLVEFVVDQDCKGSGYYAFSDEGIELIGSGACSNVKASHRVASIENFAIFDQGVQAYDHVRDRCQIRPQSSVVFSHNEGYITLPCTRLPTRPHFLYFDPQKIRLLLFRKNLSEL